MSATNPFSNPFTPAPQPAPSVFAPVVKPPVESECVVKVQKLMQDVLSAYSQVVQAGPAVLANALYLKAVFQYVEFEVLKINLAVMPRLSAEDKVQVFNAVQHTWTTVASNSTASLQQMNTVVTGLYSRILSDPQALQSSVTIVQMLYVMNLRDFYHQIATTALDSLHRMRIDMVTAGNIR